MRILLALALVALPFAGPALAGDGTCLPSCEVSSSTVAFLPPVTIVERGSSVEWSSLDIGHAASDMWDGTTPPTIGTCFFTDYTPARPNSAYFTIQDGALFALSDLGFEECEHATALPDGSFVLDYICPYHNRMTGTLVVR